MKGPWVSKSALSDKAGMGRSSKKGICLGSSYVGVAVDESLRRRNRGFSVRGWRIDLDNLSGTGTRSLS